MISIPTDPERSRIATRLSRSSGRLSTAALSRMEHDMPWVRELSAEGRSWIGLIVQAGVKAFIDWYRDPDGPPTLRASVFGVAPVDMASEVTLQQTVSLVRLAVDVVDENLEDVLGDADAVEVRAALNRYAREIAFATAEVYARAAEQRGAWDARLEALAVDAILSNEDPETITSRVSALGWNADSRVVAVVGTFGDGATLEQVRRIAREVALGCLCAVQGDRLVTVLGGVDDEARRALLVSEAFAAGPVVIGPVVDDVRSAYTSAAAALAGLRVVRGWPQAPRPVHTADLLPERVLVNDATARSELLDEVYRPLCSLGTAVLSTVATYLEGGGSIEATARALYIHPNTVRYRLRHVVDATGRNVFDPRDAYTLRLALTVGRLHEPGDPTDPTRPSEPVAPIA